VDAKPKRRTRERILEAALELFNEFGVPGVATATIAETMNISPGNLYYHFHSKEKIVEALFADFSKEIEATLSPPARKPPHAEDIWLFLHLLFESISKFRFIYRDLNELLSRYHFLEVKFRRILDHKVRTATTIMRGLVVAGEMKATPDEVDALATTMTMVASYWLSFSYARDPRAPIDGRALARGAFYVISLAAPYLAPKERELFDVLARRYLH
jgi:AcrR family transcriptional regulator